MCDVSLPGRRWTRIALWLSVLTLMGVQTSTAAAHATKRPTTKMGLDKREKAQLAVIKHDLDVLRFFQKRTFFLIRSHKHWTAARKQVRFHRAQLKWVRRELKETRAAIKARDARRLRLSTDWRAYLVRLVGRDVATGCALPLIGRESGGNVTIWNRGGSGAYGLGQALPASKMAAFGSDYMTNGVTQIKWMHSYVNRYGGWCAANSFQLSRGWY